MSDVVKAGEVVIHCGHVGDGRKKDVHWLEVPGGLSTPTGDESNWLAVCDECAAPLTEFTAESLWNVMEDDFIVERDIHIDTSKARD